LDFLHVFFYLTFVLLDRLILGLKTAKEVGFEDLEPKVFPRLNDLEHHKRRDQVVLSNNSQTLLKVLLYHFCIALQVPKVSQGLDPQI
jgi:hypothetical protein